MAAHSDALALLKVLIAAAWADSRLSQSELNYLKALAQKFNLNDADWLALEPHLEDPPSEDEVKAFFQDLLSRTATSSGRNEVIRHIERILNADAQITSEEHDFLEQYTLILKEASTVECCIGRTNGLFQKQTPAELLVRVSYITNNHIFMHCSPIL